MRGRGLVSSFFCDMKRDRFLKGAGSRGHQRFNQTDKHRQAGRQTDKQTDRQTDRQTDKQTNKQTDRRTSKERN